MKKSKLIVAIIIMAIMATTVAVVSCKKDNGNTSTQKGYTIQQPADIRQMEDPRTYMLDFKKKLTESKDNEAFNIDDAAWHLACLANLDFCNVNVECDDFQFDTIEMQVNVTDGIILLGDLRTAYEQMCTEIRQFKNGFSHCDQNLYYINVSIGAEGNARIALMTSYTVTTKDLDDHQWYFSDFEEALSACFEYYDEDSIYTWNTTAARELKRILNLFEHYDSPTIGPGGSLVQCYFPTRNHTFDYTNTYDPYSNPYYYRNNSRVFARYVGYPNEYYVLTIMEFCYCLDSYLGLGYDFIEDNLYANEHPVNWKIFIGQSTYYSMHLYYHQLKVEYGQLISINPPGPIID